MAITPLRSDTSTRSRPFAKEPPLSSYARLDIPFERRRASGTPTRPVPYICANGSFVLPVYSGRELALPLSSHPDELPGAFAVTPQSSPSHRRAPLALTVSLHYRLPALRVLLPSRLANVGAALLS